jgi:hypothetical protein
MKHLITSLLFLAASSSIWSQWYTSGNIIGTTDFIGSTGTNTNPIIFKTSSNTLTLLERMRIQGGNGQVGIWTAFPITPLHVNGDLTIGSDLKNRKWRFISQNWIDGGKMFFLPDKQDGTGNPDYTHCFTIDPIGKNFIFGYEEGMVKVAMGRTTELTLNNYYSPTDNYNFDGNMYIGFNATHIPYQGFQTYGDGTNNGSSVIWNNTGGELAFSVMPSTGGSHELISSSTVNDHLGLRVRWNSVTDKPQVIIGTTTITAGNHTDFRLSVDGKILAQEIYVTTSNWADYVFDDNYQLMSLDSLQDYIKTNNHLPNVPTTEEVLTNGNNTGETDRILLEKVEELTLYIIQLNKTIEQQNIRIEELEQKEKVGK